MGQGDDQRGETVDQGDHGGRSSFNGRPDVVTSGNSAEEVVSEETRDDVGAHGFWRQGTTALFDVYIVNLDTGYYLRMVPKKDLVKAEKEKRYR